MREESRSQDHLESRSKRDPASAPATDSVSDSATDSVSAPATDSVADSAIGAAAEPLPLDSRSSSPGDALQRSSSQGPPHQESIPGDRNTAYSDATAGAESAVERSGPVALNPFEAPSLAGLEDQDQSVAEVFRKDLNIGWIFGKWFLVCGVSAAPSFIWGCWIGEVQTEQIIGMLAGILTFIIGYTLVECTQFVQRLLNQPFVRLTAKIGYGTRMAISILFPVGMGIDMFVGLIAVGLTTSVLGEITGTNQEGLSQGFVGFYVTTLVQGTLLNLILFGYMLLVYSVAWLAGSSRSHS